MWRTGPHRIHPRFVLSILLVVATLISLWPGAAAVATPTLRVTSISLKTFPGVVQVGITGSGPLRFRTSSMSNPFRVLIDVPGAALADGVPATLAVNQPPVLRVRAGQFQQSTVRVVIDLTAPTAYQVSAVTPTVLAARLTVPLPVAVAPKAVAAAAPVVAKAPPAVAQAAAPTTPGKITIDLRGAEIADVLSALAKLCNFNIVTDASVKGTIVVRLVDITCDEALRFILETNNLGFRRVGNNMLVMAADKLAPPAEVPEPVIYPLAFADVDRARAAIAASVPGVRVAVDQRANLLIVFGTTAQHEQVQKILAALDIRIPQIMIETRVVDINVESLRSLGLTWGTLDGLIGFEFTITPGPLPTISVVGETLLAFLTALVQNDKARVLSAPRVAVLDGNKATVNLGQEFPVPSIDTNGRVSFTFKPIGVILEITPRLNRDQLITTNVTTEISSVLRTVGEPVVPVLATRKANTTVQVKNGDSIVIAGLISAEERVTTIKVPLLGDIPILGELFKRTRTERRETEVIFVVTPTIISTGR